MALTTNTSTVTNDGVASKVGPFRANTLLAYDTLSAGTGTNTITPGATTTAAFIIYVPYACTVQRVHVACVSSAGGVSRPTFNIAGTTLADTLLASAGTVVSAGAVVFDSGTTPALKYNVLTKGEILTFNLTTVASEVVTALNCYITVAVTDYILSAVTYE